MINKQTEYLYTNAQKQSQLPKLALFVVSLLPRETNMQQKGGKTVA